MKFGLATGVLLCALPALALAQGKSTGKASDHRIAAPSRWTGRVERPEKLFQFVPRKCLGQFGLTPARRLRHSVHQIGDVVAEQFAMAEIASNRARHDADRTPAPCSVI